MREKSYLKQLIILILIVFGGLVGRIIGKKNKTKAESDKRKAEEASKAKKYTDSELRKEELARCLEVAKKVLAKYHNPSKVKLGTLDNKFISGNTIYGELVSWECDESEATDEFYDLIDNIYGDIEDEVAKLSLHGYTMNSDSYDVGFLYYVLE